MDKKNVQIQKVNIIIEIFKNAKIGPYHNGVNEKNDFSKPYHKFF
jgi:hypothetical protein